MFVKLVRINEDNEPRELIVDTNEIVFLSEATDHVNYDEPTEWETITDEDTGEEQKIPTKWTTSKRYVIAFKNGKHPQFLDSENYQILKDILLNK